MHLAHNSRASMRDELDGKVRPHHLSDITWRGVALIPPNLIV